MPASKTWPRRIAAAGTSLLKDAHSTSMELFRIMVPVLLAVKLLKELGAVTWLAMPLEPVMELLGLPAQTGLVWATAMIMNLYSAVVVYAALLPDMQPVTVAQVTVLATVLLIAHNLPVELRISQRCGCNIWGQFVLRVLGGFVCGLLLHLVFTHLDLLQTPSSMLFTPDQDDQGLWAWSLGQLRNLAAIYCIVLVLMGLVRLLQLMRLTDFIGWLLRPVLRVVGIGPKAATITVLGLTLGIAYGGGLIIHEVRKGDVPHKDVFASMSLMGLSHGLIEDTLLMALLGANTLGTLWFRIAFSLVVVALLVRIRLRLAPSPRGGHSEPLPS